jgi:membrane protease YdiL (CAAX protease family)
MKSSAIYSAEPAKGWLPWGAFAPFLGVLLVAVPTVSVDFALEHFQLEDAKGDPLGLTGLIAFLIFPFVALGLVVFAWVLLVERRPLATIGLAGPHRAKKFLLGLSIGMATVLAVTVAIWAAGGFEAKEYGRAFGSSSALMNLGILLACFTLQSSVEEVVFRGWLLSVTAVKFNIPSAVVLTSLAFSFLHYSPHQPFLVTLGTLLFSVFACLWALKAKSIWGVMGWHSGWNWLLATGFELPVTGLDAKQPALLVHLVPRGPGFLTGGAQGPEGSYLCSLFFVGASALLLWRMKRKREALGAEPAR